MGRVFDSAQLTTQYTLVTVPRFAANLVTYLTAHLYQRPVFI